MKASVAAVVLLSSLGALAEGPATFSPSAADLALAKKFAPLIMLAKDEPYLPSSVEFFAPHVSIQCNKGGATGSVLAVVGKLADVRNPANHCVLTTKQKLTGPSHILPFFKGQDPSKTPVPVYVSFYRSAKNGALNIQYLNFYPYNWGKNVCLSLAPKDHCMAKRHQMDNHVGDWEGLTIQVKDGKLAGVRVGAHAASRIGFTYVAGATGKCADESGSGDLNKVSPLGCLEVRDNHPVVYAAWGSHGLWGKQGGHNYQTLPTGERLNDHTSAGKQWRTWESMVVADPGKLPFLYQGRWGNRPESVPNNRNACKLSPVPAKLCGPAGIPDDEFELNDGPGAPDLNRDYKIF